MGPHGSIQHLQGKGQPASEDGSVVDILDDVEYHSATVGKVKRV